MQGRKTQWFHESVIIDTIYKIHLYLRLYNICWIPFFLSDFSDEMVPRKEGFLFDYQIAKLLEDTNLGYYTLEPECEIPTDTFKWQNGNICCQWYQC